MKNYLTFIRHSQTFLLAISIIILSTLPPTLALVPAWFDNAITILFYDFAHSSLFLVMMVRPLADIFTQTRLIRPLVILRKGMGVFSASIIVSFILSKLIISPTDYLQSLTEASYWSLSNLALFAHLADLSAIVLLVTSNNLSKRWLGSWWKRVQRLSYLYFYSSGIYVFFVLGEKLLLIYMILVTLATTIAWLYNHNYLRHQTKIPATL